MYLMYGITVSGELYLTKLKAHISTLLLFESVQLLQMVGFVSIVKPMIPIVLCFMAE